MLTYLRLPNTSTSTFLNLACTASSVDLDLDVDSAVVCGEPSAIYIADATVFVADSGAALGSRRCTSKCKRG